MDVEILLCKKFGAAHALLEKSLIIHCFVDKACCMETSLSRKVGCTVPWKSFLRELKAYAAETQNV